MKKFMLLHYGYETPTCEIMDAWTRWFASIEDRVLENYGPFGPGREITPGGAKELPLDRQALTGFSVIQAEDMADAVRIAGDCPSITSIRVYEVRSM